MTIAPTLDAQLLDLETRLLHPETSSTIDELAALLDDRFVEFGQSGRVYDKARVVAALRAHALGAGAGGSRSIVDLTARLLAPGVALVTYRALEARGADQAPLESLRSSVWIQSERGWRIAFHQGTPRPTTG